MLSLRATTLAAIAFMKTNYTICGKRITDLKCPLCDATLGPETWEYKQGGMEPVYSRGCLSSYVKTGFDTFSLRARCSGCHGSLSITDAFLDKLDLTCHMGDEPTKTIHVEYIVMGITAVKYGRIKSLPNYENERMEVEVELKDGQTAEAALIEAKRFVKTQLGLGPSDKDVKAARQLLIEAGELSA